MIIHNRFNNISVPKCGINFSRRTDFSFMFSFNHQPKVLKFYRTPYKMQATPEYKENCLLELVPFAGMQMKFKQALSV